MMFYLIVLLVIIYQVGGNTGNFIFPPLPVTVSESGNVVCERHGKQYQDNLREFKLWAYEMRDATAKSTSGILRGSSFNFGDFQQCLTAKAPFPTQYCLVDVVANVTRLKTPRDPFSIYFSAEEPLINKLYPTNDLTQGSRNVVKLGWCMPSSCTPKDAENSLNRYLSDSDLPLLQENVSYLSKVPPILCRSSNYGRYLDSADILFCTLTGCLITIVLISTIWDYRCADVTKKHWSRDVVMAFSARGNFLDLAKSESSERNLRILYGIKTYAICMIIINHRFGQFCGGPILNYDYVEESYRNFWVSYIFHGDLFVDTFFIVSGLLVVYSLLKVYEKKFVNPGFVILLRYLRLTPPYAFVVFFCATMLYFIGDGPLWEAIIHTERNDCRQNWWTNILYLSNYVNVEHVCLVPSWYLPCDFHYFIIALILMLLYKKNKAMGMSSFIILACISVLTPMAIIYIYEKQAFLRFLPDFLQHIKTHEDVVTTYTKTHFRASPYFMGMVAGYVFYGMKDKVVLSKVYSYTILVMSFCLMFISLFSGAIFYDPYHTYNALEHAIYGALHRPIWSLGTIGLVFAVGYSEHGFIYSCLSWKIWIPLSKLVFGAYLVHFPIQLRATAMVTSPHVFNFFDIVSSALSDIFLAFLISLGLYLIVEAPSKKIFTIILSPKRDNEHEQKLNEDSKL